MADRPDSPSSWEYTPMSSTNFQTPHSPSPCERNEESTKSLSHTPAKASPKAMADPFEVRMRFTSQLQHLNASVTSAQKAAHYALKYRDMDEDLHSCILEQLERNNLNSRANILYFMEHLCDLATREDHPEFIRMMSRDILRIIDLVAPEDGSGAANVKVVRKVLAGMQAKSYLTSAAVKELEECVRDRDQIGGQDVDGAASPVAIDQGPQPNGKASTASKNGTPAGPSKVPAHGNVRFEKRQIEQRIEEDRERHKRARENVWAVGPTDDEEFERMWDETSPLNSDDEREAREQAEERRICAEMHAKRMDARFAERRRLRAEQEKEKEKQAGNETGAAGAA